MPPPPPTDRCQQEAMTHLNPKSCLLASCNGPDMAGHRPQATSHTGHCLDHNPTPLMGQQRSLLVALRLTRNALHTTQYRGKPEAAAVAGKERALRLRSCW